MPSLDYRCCLYYCLKVYLLLLAESYTAVTTPIMSCPISMPGRSIAEDNNIMMPGEEDGNQNRQTCDFIFRGYRLIIIIIIMLYVMMLQSIVIICFLFDRVLVSGEFEVFANFVLIAAGILVVVTVLNVCIVLLACFIMRKV